MKLRISKFLKFKYLNLFQGLLGTNLSPYSRVLRTDFKGKMWDAFCLFSGIVEVFPTKVRLVNFGLFDLFTLGIPGILLLLSINAVLDDRSTTLEKILGMLGLIIQFPFLLARVLIAAVLVFNPISLIIIGAVELISQYIAGGTELKRQVAAACNRDKEDFDWSADTYLFIQKGDDICLRFSDGFKPFYCGDEVSSKEFSISFENQVALKAAFRLNLGQITNRLEQMLRHTDTEENEKLALKELCDLLRPN